MKEKSSRPAFLKWWQKNRSSCFVLLAALLVFVAARLAAVSEEAPQSQAEEYAEYENAVVTAILADSTFSDPAADGAMRGEQLLLAEIRTGQYKGELMQAYNYVGPLYGGVPHAP